MTEHPNFKYGMWVGPQFQHLFHGTSHPIEGNHIVPGVESGHSQWGNTGADYEEPSEHWAWATPSESVAWGYAMHSATQHDDWRDAQRDPAKRARVHEVSMKGPMSEGKTWSLQDHGHQEFKAESFEKTGPVHDIMPGRQGTFPQVNWTQFHRDPATATRLFEIGDEDTMEDPNHPKHPAMPEESRQLIPEMRPPKDTPTLPLGSIRNKEWDGKIRERTVDDAAEERISRASLPPYKMGEIAGEAVKRGEDPQRAIWKATPKTKGVTPSDHMPEHRQRYPGMWR